MRGFEMESFNLPLPSLPPRLLKEEVKECARRVEGGPGEGRRERGRDRQTDRVGCTLEEEEEKLSQVSQKGFMYILMHN